VVALKHNRNYIGIELNPEYIKIAEKRISETTPNQIEPPKSVDDSLGG
jgi:DNA modification methylase